MKILRVIVVFCLLILAIMATVLASLHETYVQVFPQPFQKARAWLVERGEETIQQAASLWELQENDPPQ